MHAPGWTAVPQRPPTGLWIFRQIAAELESAIPDGHADEIVPAGWVRDLPIWRAVKPYYGRYSPFSRQIGRAWHTWFTGLYPYTYVAQDIWFHGGRLGDIRGQLELRNRSALK